MHACTHVCMYTRRYVCKYVYTEYTCIYMFVSVGMNSKFVDTNTYEHIYTNAYTYIEGERNRERET